MGVARMTITALLLFPAIGFAQDKREDEANKVSNDKPDRPLQMPPASSEVKEAFDDFERFARRGAWERALKSLYSIPETQAGRFVDGSNGFIIPVARKRRDMLAALPPEGQVAYRLFYDDEAKKLLEQAQGASELSMLERVYSAYFPTTFGDDAADRLGDCYFESGRFDRAADCWLAILRDRPDTDRSPALVSIKAALALSRAGRQSELTALRRDVTERYSSDRVSVGGRVAPASEQLRELLGDGLHHGPGAWGADTRPALSLEMSTGPDTVRRSAAWQLRFAESVTAGMTPAERVQWDSNPLSGAIPVVAVETTKLYANYLGYVFAIDLKTGKLLWRSASFHNVETPASQGQARMIDPARFAIVASKDQVWSLGRDLKDPNYNTPFRLVCRRADGGEVVWQSVDLPDYSQLDLVGPPLLAGRSLFVVAKTLANNQGTPAHQYVLSVRPKDGKVLWKADVGMFRQSQRYFYYGMRDNSPLPRLYHQGGAIYVDTHAGILARIDAESGEVEWGYGYQTEPVQGDRFFFFYGMDQPKDQSASSIPLRLGEALFVKGAKSERVYALDPDRMKLLWDRPIAESARLLGVDDRALYLGGPELSALDRRTRSLLWATRLPGGSGESLPYLRRDGLWQLTPRGIFEIDPRSGRVRRIFRGDDTGSDGGDLYATERLLVAVSNRTISAYSLVPAAAGDGEGRVTSKSGASND